MSGDVARPADLMHRLAPDEALVEYLVSDSTTLAFVVTATTVRGPADPRGDRLRGVVAILALLTAPAWLAADLGFFLPGHVYRTAPYYVHHGHHHGMDGVLLVLSSLLLSRQLPAIRVRVRRLATAAFLALMFAYGWGNIANDFWLEQVVKRGWTTWEVPDVTTPKASTAWALIVIAAIVLWLIFVLPLVRREAQPARSTTATP